MSGVNDALSTVELKVVGAYLTVATTGLALAAFSYERLPSDLVLPLAMAGLLWGIAITWIVTTSQTQGGVSRTKLVIATALIIPSLFYAVQTGLVLAVVFTAGVAAVVAGLASTFESQY